MKSIMRGEIATYRKRYFMIGIVYSSKSGNTELLANSLNFMESKYCFSVENIGKMEPVDLLCVGFWCDKGDCDERMQQFLSTLKNQKIFLFGTAGYGRSKEYFERILTNVEKHIDDSNAVVGTYMCQGKMPLSIRKKFESNPEMLRNFDLALKHPNDKDVDGLLKSVNHVLYNE